MKNPYEPPRVPSTLRKPGDEGFRAGSADFARQIHTVPPLTAVLGPIVGAGARLLRPYAEVGAYHYDAIGALVVLLLASAVLVYHNRTLPRAQGHVLYQLENLLLWLGFTCGWLLIHGEIWWDFVAIVTAWQVCVAVLGSIILVWLQFRRHRATAAPRE